MSLHLAIAALYPEATLEDYRLQDDGAGPYIALWNEAKLGAPPTEQALAGELAKLPAPEPPEPRVRPVLVPTDKTRARQAAQEEAQRAASAAIEARLEAERQAHAEFVREQKVRHAQSIKAAATRRQERYLADLAQQKATLDALAAAAQAEVAAIHAEADAKIAEANA